MKSASNKKKMGRPIVGEPKDVICQIRLDVSSAEKLNKLAEERGISKSELVRRLLKKAK